MFVFIQKNSELGCDRAQDDAVCRRRLSIFLDQGNLNKRRRRPQIRSGRGWFLNVLRVLIIPGAVCSVQCAVCSVQCSVCSIERLYSTLKGRNRLGRASWGRHGMTRQGKIDHYAQLRFCAIESCVVCTLRATFNMNLAP